MLLLHTFTLLRIALLCLVGIKSLGQFLLPFGMNLRLRQYRKPIMQGPFGKKVRVIGSLAIAWSM